jgi:hypothetical protein
MILIDAPLLTALAALITSTATLVWALRKKP